MYLLAAVCLGLQSEGIPESCKGIWAAPSGQVLIVDSPNTAQARVGDRHLMAFGLHAVSDGTILGNFYAFRSYPVSLSGDKDRTILIGEGAPESKSDRGEFRIYSPILDPYKNLKGFRALAQAERGDPPVNGSFAKVGGLSLLDFKGKFEDARFKVEITKSPTKDKDTIGSLEYGGSTWKLQAAIEFGRLNFITIDEHTDKRTGAGYVEWVPSTSCVNRLRDKQAKVTDQLIVFLTLNDNSLGKGEERILKRAG